jgi:endonuclease-3
VTPRSAPAKSPARAPVAAKKRAANKVAQRKVAASTNEEQAAPKRKPAPRSKADRTEHARLVFERLRELHPDAHCELDHRNAFELLVATVLSAQTTDKLVNKATPALFARYPDARTLGAADAVEVAELLRSGGLGMYNTKAKNIVGLAQRLVRDHGAEVPRSLDRLVELPGVGRKTANVVLGVIWGDPAGVVVDTHVQRLSQRLGFTKETEPGPIELALCELFPRKSWDPLSHTLIFHGRRVCFAQRPACAGCGVSELCPNAFRAENVGRKKRPSSE